MRLLSANTEVERFLRFVDIPAEINACWIWQGRARRKGYGAFSYKGKDIVASRASYLLLKGDIPSGLFVCHSCDNPPCVNPEHLWLGTYTDNRRDMIEKGRGGIYFGETNGRAKLTDTQIAEIFALKESGLSCRSIGKIYSIDNSHVSRVLRGIKRNRSRLMIADPISIEARATS